MTLKPVNIKATDKVTKMKVNKAFINQLERVIEFNDNRKYQTDPNGLNVNENKNPNTTIKQDYNNNPELCQNFTWDAFTNLITSFGKIMKGLKLPQFNINLTHTFNMINLSDN